MNKIISWILSIVMLILSFFGIGTGNTGDMTKGDWLNEMCATLGLEAAEDETVADVADEASTEVDGTVTDGEPAEATEENTTEEVSDVATPADEVTVNN